MTDFIFYNEEWNVHLEKDKSNEICSIHNILLDKDGTCKKCLEENNK
jgi:hypothetical protein